jgi:phage baseplate assembly protein W
MPEGLSPKLPMSLHPSDGYKLTKTYKEMVKQNMKMLILTSPGERMMDPYFGVGLRNFLFQPNHPKTWGTIEGRIKIQVKKYMPFVKVQNIDFGSMDDNPNFGSNTLSISLTYIILPLDSADSLNLFVSGEDTGSVSMNSI